MAVIGVVSALDCRLQFDGLFALLSGATVVFIRTNVSTTSSSYIAPSALFWQENGSLDVRLRPFALRFSAHGSSLQLGGDLLIDNSTWIVNATSCKVAGFLRTLNCMGAPRSKIMHFTGFSWDIFNISSSGSCLVGVDDTVLAVGGSGLRLAPSSVLHLYRSTAVVDSEIFIEAHSSVLMDRSGLTLRTDASLVLEDDVVFNCWFGSRISVEGGSVGIFGDDRPPAPAFPGLAFLRESALQVVLGNIYLFGRTYLYFDSSQLLLSGGSVFANYGRLQLGNSSCSISSGSLLLTNGSIMWAYGSSQLEIRGGNVSLADSSYLEIDASQLRVSGRVSLLDNSLISVFSNGTLVVENGSIQTSPRAAIRLENRGGGPGFLRGFGEIAGRVENIAGVLSFESDAPTRLSVDSYSQGRDGFFSVRLDGSGLPSTSINASGNVSISGSIAIRISSEAAARLRGGMEATLISSSGGIINGSFDDVKILVDNLDCGYTLSRRPNSLVVLFDPQMCPSGAQESPSDSSSSMLGSFPLLWRCLISHQTADLALIGGATAAALIGLIVVLIAVVFLVPSLRTRFLPALASAQSFKAMRTQVSANSRSVSANKL